MDSVTFEADRRQQRRLQDSFVEKRSQLFITKIHLKNISSKSLKRYCDTYDT